MLVEDEVRTCAWRVFRALQHLVHAHRRAQDAACPLSLLMKETSEILFSPYTFLLLREIDEDNELWLNP